MLLLTQNLAGGGGGYSPPALSWDFNSGVNGVKVDVADTPSAGDDAFASVTENTASGGHFKYSNVAPAHGPLGLRVETGVTAVSTYAQWDITGSGLAVYFRTAVYIPTGSTFAARLDFWQYRDAATRTRFAWDTSRRLQVVNGSTVVGTMTAAIPFDTTVRVEGRMVIDAAAGVLEVKLFTGDSETPTETLTVTGLNTGTVECTNVRMGSPFAVASLGPIYFDDFGIAYAGYMGPAGSAAAVEGPVPLVVPSTTPPASSPLVVVARPVTAPDIQTDRPARPVVVAGILAPLPHGSVATVRRGPAPVQVAARPTIAAAALPPPAVPVVLVTRPGADPVVINVAAGPPPLVVPAGPPPPTSTTALVVRTLVDALAAPVVPPRPLVVIASAVPPATAPPSSSKAAVDPSVVVDVQPRPAVVVTATVMPPATSAPTSSRPLADPAAAPVDVPGRPVVVTAGPVPPPSGTTSVTRTQTDPAAVPPQPVVVTVQSVPAPGAAVVVRPVAAGPAVAATRPVVTTSTLKPAEVAAVVITRPVPGGITVPRPATVVVTALAVPPHPGRALVTRAMVPPASTDFYATAGTGVLVVASAGSSTATAAAGSSPSTLAPAAGSSTAQAPSGSSPVTGVPTAGQG